MEKRLSREAARLSSCGGNWEFCGADWEETVARLVGTSQVVAATLPLVPVLSLEGALGLYGVGFSVTCGIGRSLDKARDLSVGGGIEELGILKLGIMDEADTGGGREDSRD